MKRLTIGLIIGLMLGLSTNAIAAVGDRVTAVFAEFSYVVNGEAKTLDAPVLVHDGNSYLRTTQISNMLGYDVTYKADTRTIEFDNPAMTPSAPPTPVPSGESTPTESPVVSPEPTPTPDNTAVCKAIRDKYSAKITMLPYQGLTQSQVKIKELELKYDRDQELSATGCQ